MYVTRFFASLTPFLTRLGYSRWLLSSFILASFFAVSCGRADDQPAAADLSKVEITLQRSPCRHSCPDYTVTIHGDGRVVFTASSIGVVWPGTHEDHIAPGAVAALFEQFREARFFDLRSSYRDRDLWFISEDAPTVLTVDTGQRRKSLEDHTSWDIGMPASLAGLERAVDEVAGTDRWVRGSAGLIAWLEVQNFDFHSSEAARLAVAGAHGRADEAMILALVDHGAPLDNDAGMYPPEPVRTIREKSPKYTPPPAGVSLMEGAIRRGRVKLFNELVAAGWLDRIGKDKAAQAFARSGAGCSPALVDAAADAGISIDPPAPGPMTVLRPNGVTMLPTYYTGLGQTALANLGMCREADRVATARRLLARGANPNHLASWGHIPLIAWLEEQHFDFHSTEAAQLAASGAQGKGDEDTVLALIDRGAPLDSEVSADGPYRPKRDPAYTPLAGFSLIESAIERGQARLFNRLVAAGWVDRMGKEKAARLFAQYAAGCSPALVDAAADAGIGVDEPASPWGRTALANLGTSYHVCGGRGAWEPVPTPQQWADRVATAQRLLARGADPNRRDGSGHTSLYGVRNPGMVNLLEAYGAERR
jgi:hypothetical protein